MGLDRWKDRRYGDNIGKGIEVQISLEFSGDCKQTPSDWTRGFAAEGSLDQ